MIAVAEDKSPSHNNPKNIDAMKIAWSFKYFDDYVWHGTDYRTTPFIQIGSHMKSFEMLTWREVRCRNPKHDHPIRIDALVKVAKERLETVTKGQFDELWRFRFSGTQRL